LASKNAEPYDACPYCLTEISLEEENSVVMEEGQKSEAKEIEIEEPSRLSYSGEKPTPSKSQGCAHYFGYLSERSAKGHIPDECMICESIVQCMLKNVTS